LGSNLKNSILDEKVIEAIDHKFLQELFPSELMDYFTITHFETLCSVEIKQEYWLIDFEERNIIPNGYSSDEYESKGFMESAIIQDFPLRGKGVFLRIKKRRWRHKQNIEIIRRDFSFIADGSKFTQELSDFLKDASGYKARYHQQYSELL
jgi:hypothetical protein